MSSMPMRAYLGRTASGRPGFFSASQHPGRRLLLWGLTGGEYSEFLLDPPAGEARARHLGLVLVPIPRDLVLLERQRQWRRQRARRNSTRAGRSKGGDR